MNNSFYVFPALRGRQGKHDYYILLCPLHLIPRVFFFDEAQVPTQWQPRSPLDSAKVQKLVSFLQTHDEEYVLAPLVATVNERVEFNAFDGAFPELGSVKIPLRAIMAVQDGQHRRAAVAELLVSRPELIDNTVPVMLLPDPILDRSAAIFASLNQTYVQSNASRRIAHDSASALAQIARRVAEETLIFQGRIDYERTTISNRSTAMFTMYAVFQATQAMLEVGEQAEISDEQAEFALRFWTVLGDIIPEWRQVIAGRTSPAALRPNFVHVHSVTLLAIGRAGAALRTAYPNDWQIRLQPWGTLDWSRQNPAWEGRAMLQGRMSKKHTSIQLTSNLLKVTLGLPLTEKERELEKLLGS